MARTRRASRKQRGGFLDWLFGEKKNAPMNAVAPEAANTGAAANMTTPVGGRRKSRAHRKSSRKTYRKVHRKVHRKNRKASRRY